MNKAQILSTLASVFSCSQEEVEAWIVKHYGPLPDGLRKYLARHGMKDIAEKLA